MAGSLTLKDLPTPPPGEEGWPWTIQAEPLPERTFDGSEWPRVTIVTPSYNQGRFLEETIRSVLLQGYPNLEYIIIDGGSDDNSLDIIHKYEKWLTYWVSEPDSGQAHAINKGFNCASGSIFNWLNSDDILLPGAIKLAVFNLLDCLNDLVIVYGLRVRIDENSNIFDFDIPPNKLNKFMFRIGSWIPQETAFFTKDTYIQVGGLCEQKRFALDYDFWLRCQKKSTKFKLIKKIMGAMRFHTMSKSCSIGEIGQLEFCQSRKALLGDSFISRIMNQACDLFLSRLILRINGIQKTIFKLTESILFNDNLMF